MNGDASSRTNRTKVRLPDRLGKAWHVHWENQEGNVALPMRLRGRSGQGIAELALYSSPQDDKELRVPNGEVEYPTRDVHDAAVRHLGRHEAQVLKPKRQRLQELWGTGHNGVQTVGNIVREFLGGYARRLLRAINAGPYQRKQGIQQVKLSVGDPTGAGEQHKVQPHTENPQGLYDCHAGRSGLRLRERHLVGATDTLRLAATRSANHEGTSAVFDLVNCGPRNRFVVRGDDGQLLVVHNCGAVYSDTGEVVSFDSANRMSVLKEVIEESSHKVLVFVPFRHTIEILYEELRKDGITVEVIHGGVSAGKRTDIFKRFQETDDPRVLVIQPQAASHGVTLHAANTVVWWAPITSYETYAQANARVHRAGQRNKCLVVKLQGSPVESKLYRALESKEEAQFSLMELYRETFAEGVENKN
jgi:hypothetical protein